MDENLAAIPKLDLNPENVLFFDLDGTLVDTNFANFLSYKRAIENISKTDINITFNPKERFNRTSLKQVVPNLSNTDYEKIIQQKEINYKDFLHETKLNIPISEILIRYSKTNATVLVTNCRKDRALLTLDYHNLTDKFTSLIFRQITDGESKVNKYRHAISTLNLSPHSIVIFENEALEIRDAILAGIATNNVLNA